MLRAAVAATARPRDLTKSRFKLALACPTQLFYTGKSALYPDRKREDECLQALAQGGFQVGPLLKDAHTGDDSISQRGLHLVMRDGFLIGTRTVQRETPRNQGTWDLDDDLMDIDAPVLWRGGTQARAAPTIGG